MKIILIIHILAASICFAKDCKKNNLQDLVKLKEKFQPKEQPRKP